MPCGHYTGLTFITVNALYLSPGLPNYILYCLVSDYYTLIISSYNVIYQNYSLFKITGLNVEIPLL